MSSLLSIQSKRWLAILIAALLFAMSAIPVSAEESGAKAEIRLKVGSGQMKIDGEAIKIQAPYQSEGNVMVPLSVFTNPKGFGAKVKLKDNKVITLTYLKHVIVLTIGSKSATIDGKQAALAVAPASKQGVTMVPLTVIAKSFEANQSKDASTKEIVIALKAGSNTSGTTNGEASIDSDAGKSKIGDSHYGWSMNYPTGLVQTSQSQDGDSLVFRDVKKEYYLGVFVEEAKNELTADEKRGSIYPYFSETEKVVDKKTVIGDKGKAYEKIISKDKKGFFYEYRAFQANDYLYIVVFGKTASSSSELERYTGVLDSFRTDFNRADKTIKDLTQIIEGFKTFKDEDYGLSVELPKEWKTDDKSSYPWYYSDKAYMFMEVTSVVAGDTLDAWVKRRQSRFEETFAPEYRKQLEMKDVTWNGIPAKALKLSYSLDTSNWWEEYEIFAMQGEYRYYTEVAYETSGASRYGNLLETVLRTTKVEFSKVEKNFGEITDDKDMVDRTATVTKTSAKYRYSVTVPQAWNGLKINFDEESIEYSFSGGFFGIAVWDDTYSFDGVSAGVSEYYQQEQSKRPKMRIVENTVVQFAGETTKRVITEDTANDEMLPHRTITYFVMKDGKVYQIWGAYYLANGSEYNIKNLEKAMNSFVFNRPQ
ncbi:stalk domain-containing protein [Cohnella mopanensis]|uniref:stalk domain-containing protein n=1 Tax=Cohnella mopanensis TaxID=2911966 RepID=UPI001EF92F08|nr:stalk domain-containing protein [Cohnella mopanensis]